MKGVNLMVRGRDDDSSEVQTSRQRQTVDGKTVILTALEMKLCPPSKKICIGGNSLHCRRLKVHTFRYPRFVRTYIGEAKETVRERERNPSKYYRIYELTPEKGEALSYCWKCHEYMGCYQCAEIPTERICIKCDDWANQYALEEHGKLIKTREQLHEGVRIARMYIGSRMPVTDRDKLFHELFNPVAKRIEKEKKT